MDRLPPRVRPAVIEFLYDPLVENPAQVGKPLRDVLVGLHGARRGDCRILYEIREDDQLVIVHLVAHRSDAR